MHEQLAELVGEPVASSVVEQLGTVLPFAIFVAVLLWMVYNLGLSAGRTIGHLERVA